MTINIGSIELPIVDSVDVTSSATVDELKPSFQEKNNSIDSVPVKHEPEVDVLTIVGFVNETEHSQGTSIEQQKQNLKSLRTKGILDNDLNYKDFKGYLLVDGVDFADTNNSRIINEVEITARYFPWPKYHSDEAEP